MRALIERAALLAALTQTDSVTPSRSTVPILLNVLIRAEKGSVRVTATDLDIETNIAIEALVDTPGAVTVPTRTLFDIVRRADPGAQISLVHDQATDPRLKVKAGKSSYSVPTLPASDFPFMEAMTDFASFELKPDELAYLITKTRFAISTDPTRYNINGAFLHIVRGNDGDTLRMAATDGHRAARAAIPVPEVTGDLAGVTIPFKAIDAIRKVIEGARGMVTLRASETKFDLTCGATTLTAKVIDMSFPDYQRIIPSEPGATQITLKGTDLGKALDRAGIMANDKSRAVRFDFAESALTLSARNNETGHSEVQIDVTQEGGDMQVGFNSKYLHDIANLVGEGEITCHLRDPSSPVRIDPLSDENATFVVMPLRV